MTRRAEAGRRSERWLPEGRRCRRIDRSEDQAKPEPSSSGADQANARFELHSFDAPIDLFRAVQRDADPETTRQSRVPENLLVLCIRHVLHRGQNSGVSV